MPRGENKELGKSGDPLVVSAMGAGALFAALVATVGGWIGYSTLRVNHKYPLKHAIDGERRTFVSPKAGTISYYVDRKKAGRPLVLVHSIDVASSAYEMRPIFDYYHTDRPVFAVDLPGYGFSERTNRVYRPELFVGAILDLVQGQVHSTEPVDLIALSVGSEVAARAVQARPDLFRSLTLISPSGLSLRRSGGTRERQYRLISFPLWSQAVFDGLVTRAAIQFALRQRFHSAVDPALAEYAYATAHQPGARHAPLYYVSGKLSTPDIRTAVYEQLTLPVMILYDRDPAARFDVLSGLLANYHNWQAVRIEPTQGLPHFERLPETVQAMEKFWEDA